MNRHSLLLRAVVFGAAVLIIRPWGLLEETTTLAQTANCQFTLGFATLQSMIPDTVGACLENEWHNVENGDGLQQTTHGLLVWRKADNWTAFTDGNMTWINGPIGLQSRLNADRFTWEGTLAAPTQSDPGAVGSTDGAAGGGTTSSDTDSTTSDNSANDNDANDNDANDNSANDNDGNENDDNANDNDDNDNSVPTATTEPTATVTTTPTVTATTEPTATVTMTPLVTATTEPTATVTTTPTVTATTEPTATVTTTPTPGTGTGT